MKDALYVRVCPKSGGHRQALALVITFPALGTYAVAAKMRTMRRTVTTDAQNSAVDCGH